MTQLKGISVVDIQCGQKTSKSSGVHAERVKESRANEENLLMTMSGSVGCSTEEKQRQQPPLRLSYHVSNMLLFFRRLLCGQIDEN